MTSKEEKREIVKEEMQTLSQTSELAITLAGSILMHIATVKPDDQSAMQSLQLTIAQIIDLALQENDKKGVQDGKEKT